MLELDIFSAPRGAVTAPAGCGKTQLIADSLKLYKDTKAVLILTHTNAGKSVLEARLARALVPKSAYRISTIDSWSIRIVAKFPLRSGLNPSILRLENPSTDYSAIRNAALRLLSEGDISDALHATYSRLVVDEYQDCTISQHHIICWMAAVLPTCVLGDPLQAIFGFREHTVSWDTDVLSMFPQLGTLKTPWRWRNSGAENLGQWLIDSRAPLLAGEALDIRYAPAELKWIQVNPAFAHIQRMEAARIRAPNPSGTVLVIGDSTNPKSQRLIASQTPGATTVEAVDLRDLTDFGKSFDPKSADSFIALVNFSAELMTNIGAADLYRRVESLTKGSARKDATVAEAAALTFLSYPSFESALGVIEAFENSPNVRVYRPSVLHICKNAMKVAAAGESSFYDAIVKARERNRHLGRPPTTRSVGSTLLLKGLEADIAVVLNPSAMDANHLYVALTRGAKGLVVCSPTPTLTPVRRT